MKIRLIHESEYNPEQKRTTDRLHGHFDHLETPGPLDNRDRFKRYIEPWDDLSTFYTGAQLANQAVAKALKDGDLIKETCLICDESDMRAIEGHHESYRPENWLEVIWLCTQCHHDLHACKIKLPGDPS